MIDPTVWGPIILKITAEQRYFLKKEFGITEVDLRLQSLQDVSELINGLASIAFYEFNHEHQRTERADCALNLVWLLTEAIQSIPLNATPIFGMIMIIMMIIMIV